MKNPKVKRAGLNYSCRCKVCGSIFSVEKYRRNIAKYCSLVCFGKDKDTGRTTFRKKVLSVKPNICELCESIINIYVHHILNGKYDGISHTPYEADNSIENGRVVCPTCHNRLYHSREIKRFSKTANCLTCGTYFKYYPKSNRGKYCSRNCLYVRNKNVSKI